MKLYSPFTLPSKSGRGVTHIWKAHFLYCLASTSVKCLGNRTFECILVFLVLFAEAASQSTSNASLRCYILYSFCLSPQTEVLVHWFVYILPCQACNKSCYCNRVEMSVLFLTCKKLPPQIYEVFCSFCFDFDGLWLEGCNTGRNHRTLVFSWKENIP